MINIGQIIKNHCRQRGTSIKQLATNLNLNHVTFYSNLKKNDMPISRLYAISRFLNHNFFTYFTDNTTPTQEQLLKMSTENRELTAKVASLQKEVTYLQEINALLKAKT